ncbi:MAG: hypothetical protein ACQCN6_04000 [Candidatus Bathyarchaeia archaeon]
MNRKLIVATAIGLTVIVALSLFAVWNWFSDNQALRREFYVGVEFAYGDDPSLVAALVDKVKDYTNLFVLGSPGLTFNESALTEACDYIYNSKLNFIVLFTGLDRYSYNISQWMLDAQTRYGKQFIGIDRYDEPGGNQIDNGPYQLVNKTALPNPTYASVADAYVGNLTFFPEYYLQFTPKIMTADYALYWFDYKSNYTIFGEFVGNESRQRHIALCRGAAEAFGKDYGIVITWKYNQAPYLENGAELYDDLALAYSAGAKYVVVFSYPNTTSYGTLTEEHFAALQKFWTNLHRDPDSLGSNPAEVAYVVPADYGFGFRSPTDNIWGIFPADELSPKIYNDTQTLTSQYNAGYNILYDSPQTSALLQNYTQVYFWNQTIPQQPPD